MKSYTLIVDMDGKRSVVLTDNPSRYLAEKRHRKKVLAVLFFTTGDYRGRIMRFGMNAFLNCMKEADTFTLLGLNLMYQKTNDL